jgi:tyrosine-specific transport protein
MDVGRIIGGILLVAGTTLGAGILALPVVNGLLGFYPTIGLFIIYWILMTYTGLLFLEVNLWFDHDGINIISMSKGTLGKWGETVSWLLYLTLLYLLTTAYIAGSGSFFIEVAEYWLGYDLPDWLGPIPFILIFSFFVYEGTAYVDYLNRLLMIGLVVSYLMLSGWLVPRIDPQLLEHVNWKFLPFSIALVATSFGYHIIIPTLSDYLHRNVKALVQVILIGVFIAFVASVFWILVCLGVLPLEGKFGIIEGYSEGRNSVYLLSNYLGHPWMAAVGHAFVFFAIVTSFLGVSLSLRDFLSDGLAIDKERTWGRWVIYFLTFIPPMILAMTVKKAFFNALNYAGLLGVLILLVIMPILMTWAGRYWRGYPADHYKAPGGKAALILALVVALGMVALDLSTKIGTIEVLP